MEQRAKEAAFVAGSRNARLTAQLLLELVRERRFYLDEFMEGDGPYWISIGLFIDQEIGIDTTLERAMEFADESIETSRYLLRTLIDHAVAEQYVGCDGAPAYRLTAAFSRRFETYLTHQAALIRSGSRHFR